MHQPTYSAVVALLCATLTPTAYAQVYKCREGDTTVFSSTPCAANAKTITVRPASGASQPQARQKSAEETRGALQTETQGKPAERSMVERANDSARRRIIDDEIWRKQRSLDALQDELNQRQAMLSAQKSRASNTLAGAVWLQSLSDEMQAKAIEYDIKMRRISKEIEELKAKRDQIP